MFSFGFNFNFSYMPNPFCMTNVFAPCMPCVSPMYSNFNRFLSLFILNRMIVNNQRQMNNESQITSSLYDALGLSLSSHSNQTDNYYTAYNQPLYTNTYNTYNPFTILNNFSNALVSSIKRSNKYNYQANTTTKINTKTNLPQLKEVNYNGEKGTKLVNRALKAAHRTSQGDCAKYVREAIEDIGLGSYGRGDAYLWVNILRKNPNFKEINITGSELNKLPAGCVIVYDRGDQGYSSDSGHVEITIGDGRAVSDFVNKRIKPSDKAHVFVPV